MASMIEVEVKSPADKYWEAIRDSADLFPKFFPQQFKSVEIIEGDGKSTGSILVYNYAEGTQLIKFSKERIEFADDEKKIVTYSVIEGELQRYYRSFRPTIEVISKGEGGAVVRWSVEYDKIGDEGIDIEIILDLVAETLRGVDENLLKN